MRDCFLPASLRLSFCSFFSLRPFCLIGLIYRVSLCAQMVKSLPTMWETQVRSLGWEDPLEKGMSIHSRILAWRIPWTAKGKMKCRRGGSTKLSFTFLVLSLVPGPRPPPSHHFNPTAQTHFWKGVYVIRTKIIDMPLECSHECYKRTREAD